MHRASNWSVWSKKPALQICQPYSSGMLKVPSSALSQSNIKPWIEALFLDVVLNDVTVHLCIVPKTLVNSDIISFSSMLPCLGTRISFKFKCTSVCLFLFSLFCNHVFCSCVLKLYVQLRSWFRAQCIYVGWDSEMNPLLDQPRLHNHYLVLHLAYAFTWLT